MAARVQVNFRLDIDRARRIDLLKTITGLTLTDLMAEGIDLLWERYSSDPDFEARRQRLMNDLKAL